MYNNFNEIILQVGLFSILPHMLKSEHSRYALWAMIKSGTCQCPNHVSHKKKILCANWNYTENSLGYRRTSGFCKLFFHCYISFWNSTKEDN